MKFPQVTHAPEGLTTYARVKRVRPTLVLINIFEGLLALMGVVMLILLVRYHSFEKAGLAIDQSVSCAVRYVHGLLAGH